MVYYKTCPKSGIKLKRGKVCEYVWTIAQPKYFVRIQSFSCSLTYHFGLLQDMCFPLIDLSLEFLLKFLRVSLFEKLYNILLALYLDKLSNLVGSFGYGIIPYETQKYMKV